MKFNYFKILVFCIVLPPVLYIFILQGFQHYLKKSHEASIRDIYLGDVRPLLDGSERLRDVINRNINEYLATQGVTSFGVIIDVTITTRQGVLLYPVYFTLGHNHEPHEKNTASIAEENYSLMMEAMPSVTVTIPHSSPFAIILLLFHLIFFSVLFYTQYYTGFMKVYNEDLRKKREISYLKKNQKRYYEKLDSLERKRIQLAQHLHSTESKLQEAVLKASMDEDSYIEEIVALEEKINSDMALQQGQQVLITDLLKKLDELESKESQQNIQKVRQTTTAQKRFSTLYKNTVLHERAINGYMNLTDELKLKSEELIHRLNEDPDSVRIKRKVFGKKNRVTVLEVLFGYKGRLYFRRTKNDKPEVLVIGTKNTQDKDLEFLNKLER